jgi:hypothetical protein
MEKVESKWIKWWKYASFWKFFGVALASFGISLSFALLIPNAWCLLGVFATCGVGGYFMKKLLPEVLTDLQKELQ